VLSSPSGTPRASIAPRKSGVLVSPPSDGDVETPKSPRGPEGGDLLDLKHRRAIFSEARRRHANALEVPRGSKDRIRLGFRSILESTSKVLRTEKLVQIMTPVEDKDKAGFDMASAGNIAKKLINFQRGVRKSRATAWIKEVNQISAAIESMFADFPEEANHLKALLIEASDSFNDVTKELKHLWESSSMSQAFANAMQADYEAAIERARMAVVHFDETGEWRERLFGDVPYRTRRGTPVATENVLNLIEGDDTDDEDEEDEEEEETEEKEEEKKEEKKEEKEVEELVEEAHVEDEAKSSVADEEDDEAENEERLKADQIPAVHAVGKLVNASVHKFAYLRSRFRIARDCVRQKEEEEREAREKKGSTLHVTNIALIPQTQGRGSKFEGRGSTFEGRGSTFESRSSFLDGNQAEAAARSSISRKSRASLSNFREGEQRRSTVQIRGSIMGSTRRTGVTVNTLEDFLFGQPMAHLQDAINAGHEGTPWENPALTAAFHSLEAFDTLGRSEEGRGGSIVHGMGNRGSRLSIKGGPGGTFDDDGWEEAHSSRKSLLAPQAARTSILPGVTEVASIAVPRSNMSGAGDGEVSSEEEQALYKLLGLSLHPKGPEPRKAGSDFEWQRARSRGKLIAGWVAKVPTEAVSEDEERWHRVQSLARGHTGNIEAVMLERQQRPFIGPEDGRGFAEDVAFPAVGPPALVLAEAASRPSTMSGEASSEGRLGDTLSPPWSRGTLSPPWSPRSSGHRTLEGSPRSSGPRPLEATNFPEAWEPCHSFWTHPPAKGPPPLKKPLPGFQRNPAASLNSLLLHE